MNLSHWLRPLSTANNDKEANQTENVWQIRNEGENGPEKKKIDSVCWMRPCSPAEMH